MNPAVLQLPLQSNQANAYSREHASRQYNELDLTNHSTLKKVTHKPQDTHPAGP